MPEKDGLVNWNDKGSKWRFLSGTSVFNLGHVVCEMSVIHLSSYVKQTAGCTSLSKTQGVFTNNWQYFSVSLSKLLCCYFVFWWTLKIFWNQFIYQKFLIIVSSKIFKILENPLWWVFVVFFFLSPHLSGKLNMHFFLWDERVFLHTIIFFIHSDYINTVCPHFTTICSENPHLSYCVLVHH